MARKIRKVAPPAFALRGTIYHPVALTFDVHSDLFDAGRHPEDGSPMEGEAFYVVATAPDGKRWQHKSSWAFAPCGECIAHFSFGEPPEDDASDAEKAAWADGCGKCGRGTERVSKEVAEAECTKLIARIEKAIKEDVWGGPIDNPHWVEARPVYGSEAYQKGNWEARQLADELRSDEVPFHQWPTAAQMVG